MPTNSFLNRRKFLKKSMKGTIGLAAGVAASGILPLYANNKVKSESKNSNSSIKVSLFSVSYTGVWYDGPSLTIKEFIKKAKSIGYDGVEIGAKRPHASPLDMEKRDCIEIKKLADSLGIEICALASYCGFSSPVVERREYELLMLREQMRVARDMDVKVLRVFAAWPGVTMENGKAIYTDARRAWSMAFPNVTEEQRWKWVRECLEESSKYAEKIGVTLALQNHKPVVNSYKDVINMVKDISSENLKIVLDAPLLNNQEDDYVRQSVLDTGIDKIVHSHFGGEYDRQPDGSIVQRKLNPDRPDVNYQVFVKTLAEIGYNGHISYELCHPFKVDGKYCKLEDTEKQSVLALEYMRNILTRIYM